MICLLAVYLMDEVAKAIGSNSKNILDAVDIIQQRLHARSVVVKQKVCNLEVEMQHAFYFHHSTSFTHNNQPSSPPLLCRHLNSSSISHNGAVHNSSKPLLDTHQPLEILLTLNVHPILSRGIFHGRECKSMQRKH